MTQSNQPGRGLNIEVSPGMTDSDYALDAMAAGDAGVDHVGRHRRDDEPASQAAAMSVRSQAAVHQGSRTSQRSKQGNQPDAG